MAKTLYVTLDINSDPRVKVDRDVGGKPKMKWRKDDDSVDFDFVSITGLPSDVFEITEESKNKINVTNLGTGDGKIYPYTLTIKHEQDGVWTNYTTNQVTPIQTGGKPVIRN